MPDSEPDVWLIDASAIINTKKAVPANRQWALFRCWEAMVEAGTLAFHKQVRIEVTEVAHPDAPACGQQVWAVSIRKFTKSINSLYMYCCVSPTWIIGLQST